MRKTKQTKISKAWEAAEIMLKLMLKQDDLIFQREHYKRLAQKAPRYVQYQTYTCKAQVLDNKIAELHFTLNALAELLPIPE